MIGPLPESVVGLECIGKRDETADVEIVGWYSRPTVHHIAVNEITVRGLESLYLLAQQWRHHLYVVRRVVGHFAEWQCETCYRVSIDVTATISFLITVQKVSNMPRVILQPKNKIYIWIWRRCFLRLCWFWGLLAIDACRYDENDYVKNRCVTGGRIKPATEEFIRLRRFRR